MQRVVIVGPGGAGKSWVAKRIAERTDLPLIHLDREYWRPGWVKTAKLEWNARVRELIAGDRWVIDGNYGGTLAVRMDRADTIVFLDVSRWTSIAGVVTRRIRAKQRDDIASGCPERLDFEFLRWLWRYHDHHRPGRARADRRARAWTNHHHASRPRRDQRLRSRPVNAFGIAVVAIH